MSPRSLLIDHFEEIELKKSEFRNKFLALIQEAYLRGVSESNKEIDHNERAWRYAAIITKDNT